MEVVGVGKKPIDHAWTLDVVSGWILCYEDVAYFKQATQENKVVVKGATQIFEMSTYLLVEQEVDCASYYY